MSTSFSLLCTEGVATAHVLAMARLLEMPSFYLDQPRRFKSFPSLLPRPRSPVREVASSAWVHGLPLSFRVQRSSRGAAARALCFCARRDFVSRTRETSTSSSSAEVTRAGGAVVKEGPCWRRGRNRAPSRSGRAPSRCCGAPGCCCETRSRKAARHNQLSNRTQLYRAVQQGSRAAGALQRGSAAAAATSLLKKCSCSLPVAAACRLQLPAAHALFPLFSRTKQARRGPRLWPRARGKWRSPRAPPRARRRRRW